ncbi:hypothetical protein ROZALSC1DRAFT_29560 [Rozella allomycis CSF55]|uniref:RRM domain-containing protein n=1 Tax=Rozella allomycis (strain CSF55) TaxID=988480 RepID=A0A075B317_ROZAC|nr:hypothetical protein O9G_001433 [Rozella allomycis CSF55]RKP18790.1 hypothetical protein ROZALSC1DRAFT_29560 [Rozella allomycis CSF55]|eukprot:EPZ36988.1 hypothetical protein O9G_001433 [Rozella allomycis CSF55]
MSKIYKRLHLANICYDLTRDDLKRELSKYINVVELHLPTRTLRNERVVSSGNGILVCSAEDAEKLHKNPNVLIFNGRMIKMVEAVPELNRVQGHYRMVREAFRLFEETIAKLPRDPRRAPMEDQDSTETFSVSDLDSQNTGTKEESNDKKET